MYRLTLDNLTALIARHAKFNDALIKRLELSFEGGVSGRRVTVEVEAKDQESQEGWGYVRFDFRGVTMLSLREDRTTNVVLSSGMELSLSGGEVVADFSPVHKDTELSTFAVSSQEVWVESSVDT